jgi:sortase (surface protein transpeptidase)
MKKIIIFTLITIFFNANLQAAEKKDSTLEKVFKDIKNKNKKKNEGKEKSTLEKALEKRKNIKKVKTVKEKSTVEKWISGEKKITESIPNPITGFKKIKKALTPDFKSIK